MSDALTLALAQMPPLSAEDTLAADGAPPGPNMGLADQLKRWISSPNIAEELDEAESNRIAQRVILEYNLDEDSRAEWKDKYDKWMRFAMQIADQKTYPWPQASNIVYPLMTTAAIQFAARAYPAIIRNTNVVKGSVIGNDDGQPQIDPRTGQPALDPQGQPLWIVPPGIKKQRANKIGQHMSWQLLDEQEEWEPQTDKLLIIVPIVGCMFRKSYFDPGMARNVSETVTALQLCVNYKAKSFETAPRVSEILTLYPWEIEERIRSGVYLDTEYHQDTDGSAANDPDAPVTFIEQHRRWDLDGDGYPEPYIVTVARDSQKLARIKAAFDMDGVTFSRSDHRVRRIEPILYYTKYGFIPSPDGGVYDIGFGHLIYPINEAVNSTLNQMFDAGHLQNTGGGFVSSQLSMNTGAVKFMVGQFVPVNTGGSAIRDAVFPIPFPGISPVLFELLQFLVEAGKEVAAVKDVMVGDLPGDNTSGVATLAMIEQGLKVFSAIYKRVHRSLKLEFKKLFRLNRLYLPDQAQYRVGSEWHTITQADYEAGAGVEPVSDPQMVTDMQKLGRAQFLLQFKDVPHFDPVKIRELMLDAVQMPNGDSLLVPQLPPNPALALEVSKLKLEGEKLDLEKQAHFIRAAHEESDLAIRRGKDRAGEIETLSRAILNLANAAKADHEVNQQWYSLQIQALRHQVEAINAASDIRNETDNPAIAAGLSDSALAAGAGANPGAIQPLAPSPGQPGILPIPGGSTGDGGANLAG